MSKELNEFFSLLAEQKRKKSKEIKNKKIENEKILKDFESWLYSKPTKNQKVIESEDNEIDKIDVVNIIENDSVNNIESKNDDLSDISDISEIEESKEETELIDVVTPEVTTENKIEKSISIVERSLGLLAEPTDTNNSDPLTPIDNGTIDKRIDDLQKQYQLFLSRIQQQLSTLGGGGETRFEFLDDIDRNSVKIDGNILQYDSSSGKFIGTSQISGGGGGTDSYWVETNAGIYTTSNVAIGTDVVSTGSTALWVQGDARITGILSIGTGTITIDPIENVIRVGSGITLDATNNILSVGDNIVINSQTGNITIGDNNTNLQSSGDAIYAGVVTAVAFVGDGSGLTNVTAVGTGVEIRDNDLVVGTASTINFGQNLDVSFASGIATVAVSVAMSSITDVNTSNLTGISTDYLMIYDPNIPGFKFVDPKSYFGINNDFNPAPDIVDYGTY